MPNPRRWWAGTVAWRGRELAWGGAFGNGGQRLFVVPALDVAVAITAGAYNDRSVAQQINASLEAIVAAVRV